MTSVTSFYMLNDVTNSAKSHLYDLDYTILMKMRVEIHKRTLCGHTPIKYREEQMEKVHYPSQKTWRLTKKMRRQRRKHLSRFSTVGKRLSENSLIEK